MIVKKRTSGIPDEAPTDRKRIPKKTFRSTDVVGLSKFLLGKALVAEEEGLHCSGIIVETEAYRGPDDKACHAHLNRFTKRTSVMFEEGGVAYVYLCYGIHHLFNIVTAEVDMPHAILVRAIEPVENIELMMQRRNMTALKPQLTAGPGVLTKALGISKSMTGIDLTKKDSPVWIEDWQIDVPASEIIASPRVGIDYAEECIDWPWRFRWSRSKWTSPAK